MSFKASSTKERFDELQKDPLVFCKFGLIEYGYNHSAEEWSSCDATIKFQASEKDLPPGNVRRRLFVIGSQIYTNGEIEKEKKEKDTVEFEMSEFDTNNVHHWILVFNDCLYNYKSGNTRHCHMTLFWALYITEWHKEIIKETLTKVANEVKQMVCSYVSNNIFAFSVNKQYLLVDLLKEMNPKLQPLGVPDVESALKEISPSGNFNTYGFYQKVDFILDYGSQPDQREHLEQLYRTSRNGFIHFKYWMEHVGNKFYDYNYLEVIYSYVDYKKQLSIVRRYLHDVRIKLIEAEFTLFQKMRDIRYQACVDIRYFITSPGDNMEMAAPMFCDTLLSLKKSEGTKIQDFNGILDFAVSHSNRAYPKIDLGIRHFVPTCDGGLMHNPSFYGFIHYALQYTFDETKLTDERLKETINHLINKFATLVYHDYCTADNHKELTQSNLEVCKNVIKSDNKWLEKCKIKRKLNKSVCPYMLHEPVKPLKWRRTPGQNDDILNLFVENVKAKEYINVEDISIERLKRSLILLGRKYQTFSFMNGNPPKYLREREVSYHIVLNYYSPSAMEIYPNFGMFYSSKKSLLGVWDDKSTSTNQKQEEIAQKAEAPIVYANTFESLKKMFPNAEVGKDYIRLPYDSNKLSSIKAFYHYHHHVYTLEKGYNETPYGNKQFLTPRKIQGVFYCTPKVADSREKVSNLPFFWCRSDECFCNMLGEQTLDKQLDWKKYSLYHAAEILGYKLIEVTEKGNIPIEAVSNFAGEVRQAEKLYARLICRSCGHMIFSTRGTLLNGSRFFECVNSQCPQYKDEIYLSQCNNCKKGLIDSRDSKKCENGWVICPSCLACCNDNLFEKLIARHRRNGYVPVKLQECEGKGHNNKGIFFCPKCGTQLRDIDVEEKVRLEDGTDDIIIRKEFGCPQCKQSYVREKEKYDKSHA